MKKTLSFLILLTLSPLVDSAVAGENDVEMERFRVLLTTGQRIEGYQGLYSADGLKGIVKGDSSYFIGGESIRRVYRYNGTRALKNTAIGGGIGLFVGLLAGMGDDFDFDSTSTGEKDRITPALIMSGPAVLSVTGRPSTHVPLAV